MILQEEDCNFRQKKEGEEKENQNKRKGKGESRRERKEKMGEVEEKIKMEKNHKEGRKAVEYKLCTGYSYYTNSS